MRSELVTDHAAFAALAEPWDRLAARCGNPLLNHVWFDAGWQAFHRADALSVVAISDGADLVAAAPLVLVAGTGGKRLELIGVARLNEPCDFLYRDVESLRFLLAAVIARGYPLMLQRVPADSPTVAACASVSTLRGFAVRRRASDAQAVAIETDWERYYQSLSGKRRYDHRRAIKRAEKHGPLDFEMICPEMDELEPHLERFLAVEAAGWKGRRGSALAMRDDLRRFFRIVCRKYCASKQLHLCFLTIAGADAAAQVAVTGGGRLWVLKIGYDERWADCSPGVLLTWSTLRTCFGGTFTAYEFLGSAEPWLDVWANRIHRHVSYGLYPRSLQGVNGLVRDTLQFLRRKVAR